MGVVLAVRVVLGTGKKLAGGSSAMRKVLAARTFVMGIVPAVGFSAMRMVLNVGVSVVRMVVGRRRSAEPVLETRQGDAVDAQIAVHAG